MANSTGPYLIQLGLAAAGVGTDVLQQRQHPAGASTRSCRFWVTGTFVGTVNLEGSFPGAADFAPILSVTVPGAYNITLPVEEDIRFNVAAYTSGTVNLRLHVF